VLERCDIAGRSRSPRYVVSSNVRYRMHTRLSHANGVFFSSLSGEPEESRSTARQDTKVARVTRDSISYRFNRVQQIEVNEYKFRYDSQN